MCEACNFETTSYVCLLTRYCIDLNISAVWDTDPQITPVQLEQNRIRDNTTAGHQVFELHPCWSALGESTVAK